MTDRVLRPIPPARGASEPEPTRGLEGRGARRVHTGAVHC